MIAEKTNKFSGADQREAFFIAIYKKTFPGVARYIARMGGSFEEAQDIFQDTLVIYYEKLVTDEATTVINENAYMLGIAKKLWFQRCKSVGKHRPLPDHFDPEAVPDEQPASEKILRYLETTGKKCMELLKAYYYNRMPVTDVAKLFGYSGTHSATVAKYKCLEKVRETVKQNSLSYADFIE